MSNVIEPESLCDPPAWPILDVRFEVEFLAERIAGAARVPIERWEAAAKSAETGLDNAEYWHREIGALGIDGVRPVAIYDDGRLTEAARVWFILQHFGANAAIVNGGWPALKSTYSHRVVSGNAEPPAEAVFLPSGPSARVGMIERHAVKEKLHGNTAIWDARTAAEYGGRDLRSNTRGGHIPGAALLSHSALVNDHGRLKSSAELRSLIVESGFHPGQSLITHCDGGGRAALAALAALEAGYENVSVYYLSFADWAKDEACPVEKVLP